MTDWILGFFGTNRQHAQKRYQQFVKEGINGTSPMDDLQEQVVIGNKVFIGVHYTTVSKIIRGKEK